MPKKRNIAAALAVVLAPLFLQGCGGSSNSDTYGFEQRPTELDARVVQYGGQGETVPQWFQDKWGQNMYRNAPMGEGPMRTPVTGYRTPFGFVSADRKPQQGPVYQQGWTRPNPWDSLMDAGFSLE